MKTLKLLSLLLFLAMMPFLLMAQTKAEKQKLKKELKVYRKMKPKEIRTMKLNLEKKVENYNTTKTQLRIAQNRADSLQSILSGMQSRLSQMQAELMAAQAEAAGAKKGVARGYYYRVQLGAFKNFDIKAKLNKEDQTILSETTDGVDKYVVGLFFTFEEADAFKNDIRKMGIKDAFVVPFKDGKRITHKEAIEGIKANGAGKSSLIIKPSYEEQPTTPGQVSRKVEVGEYSLIRAEKQPIAIKPKKVIATKPEIINEPNINKVASTEKNIIKKAEPGIATSKKANPASPEPWGTENTITKKVTPSKTLPANTQSKSVTSQPWGAETGTTVTKAKPATVPTAKPWGTETNNIQPVVGKPAVKPSSNNIATKPWGADQNSTPIVAKPIEPKTNITEVAKPWNESPSVSPSIAKESVPVEVVKPKAETIIPSNSAEKFPVAKSNVTATPVTKSAVQTPVKTSEPIKPSVAKTEKVKTEIEIIDINKLTNKDLQEASFSFRRVC